MTPVLTAADPFHNPDRHIYVPDEHVRRDVASYWRAGMHCMEIGREMNIAPIEIAKIIATLRREGEIR